MFSFFPSDIFVLKKFKNRHRKIGDDLNGYQAMGISLVNLLSTKPEQPKKKKILPILFNFFHNGVF